MARTEGKGENNISVAQCSAGWGWRPSQLDRSRLNITTSSDFLNKYSSPDCHIPGPGSCLEISRKIAKQVIINTVDSQKPCYCYQTNTLFGVFEVFEQIK